MNAVKNEPKELVKVENISRLQLLFQMEIINPPEHLREYWDVNMIQDFVKKDPYSLLRTRAIFELVNSKLKPEEIIKRIFLHERFYIEFNEGVSDRNIIPEFEPEHRVGALRERPIPNTHRYKIINSIEQKIKDLEFNIVDYKYSSGVSVLLNFEPRDNTENLELI